MKNLITLGADPEVMVFNTVTGKITSVAGLLGCSKHKKKSLGKGVRLQEDNVLAEFDIDPCTDFETFDDLIGKGIDGIRRRIKKLGMGVAEDVCSHSFTQAELETFHESAFEFGCEPDYNGVTGFRNPKPYSSDEGLRSAGGHIHIGWSHLGTVTPQIQARMVAMCDLYLGIPSLFMDSDSRRRELYGQAGACRFKDYGIEYRTLSNFWIFRQETRRWAWEQAHKAYEAATNEELFLAVREKVNPNLVQFIINSGDTKKARHFLKSSGVKL